MKSRTKYCEFKDDHILFPNGYLFKRGYLKRTKILPYSLIHETRLSTFPPSVLINNNEIIFLAGRTAEEAEHFFTQRNIPASTAIDTWSLICEEFLDTEFDVAHKQNSLNLLAQNGIEADEVAWIRKKLRRRMMFLTVMSMEWAYYGQFDLLQQLWPLTDKKYWWTMEIALRTKSQNA